jgi:lipopolysaccharide biosynthesis glycosyltransferase
VPPLLAASTDPIHVACAFDEQMAIAGLALAASLASQLRSPRQVILHVLHAKLDRRSVDALTQLRRENFAVLLHDVRDAFSGLPVQPPFSTAIYYRLCLPLLLGDLSRVIYLDADTIVMRELSTLYDIPLDGMAVAAMPDYALYYFELTSLIPVGKRRKPVISYLREVLALEYHGPNSYFNSGVMVVNLDIWRARNIAGRCIDYIADAGYLQWPDQDALNVVCEQKFAPLDARWNAFARWCEGESRFGRLQSLSELQREWIHDPWIVHFSGDCKPWKPHHSRTVHDHLFWQFADPADARQMVSGSTSGNSLLARLLR